MQCAPPLALDNSAEGKTISVSFTSAGVNSLFSNFFSNSFAFITAKPFATKVLNELEKWASELSYQKCILETGKRQPDAIWLYQKNGYKSIPNYGKYVVMENSVCFEKEIH